MASDDGGRPSRASMREVKREYKQRRKAEKTRAEKTQTYWAKETRRNSSSRPWVAPVAGVTALAVVAVGTAFALKLGPFASNATASAASTGRPTAAATSPSPSATASASASATNDGTDPTVHAAFEDSPARAWKKGMAGVALPTARQVGIYRTSQVAAAYRMTEKYLAASNFDPHVLYTSDMEPVLRTLGSSFPSYAKQQHALYVSSHGKKGVNWLWLATRFHPGDWKAGAETRSRGVLSAARIHSGKLRVPFVLTAAYWLVPTKGGAARTVAVRRYGYLDFVGQGPNGIFLSAWNNSWISSASLCGSTWKFPEYVQAWTSFDGVPDDAGMSAKPTFDIGDPTASTPQGCWTDTSGFR